MTNRRIFAHSGATMVEMLLALPVVLLLGLGIAQFTLVYQAKHALDYALTQAARQGAVEHASAASIERGLAAGLVPYLYGAGDWAGLLQAEERAAESVAKEPAPEAAPPEAKAKAEKAKPKKAAAKKPAAKKKPSAGKSPPRKGRMA